MSLIRKQTTEAMVAANRANSLKCTGPVTDHGKMQARLNALKHGITARVPGKLVVEPGEREEDLIKLRRQLTWSLQPCDAFEERVVSEMIENRRRRDRVVRAEAGLLSAQHLDFEVEYGRKLAGEGRSPEETGQASVAAAFGLAALPDSSAKFSLILQCLRGAQGAVEREGFGEEGLARLEAVYGPEPGLAGAVVLTSYEERRKEAVPGEAGPRAEEGGAKQAFLELLASEIACFEKLLELEEKADDEPARARWESQDLLSEADSRRLTRYEAFLDCQFDRLVKRFREWRDRPRP